jgi:hypothetical protein
LQKKLSIPITVTRALKYIPELQKQVSTLEKKKEELTRASCKPGVLGMKENTAPIISATCIDDRDIMVQLSLLSNMAGALPMSKCITVLESEGLRLVSSSTSAFQNRTFYSLHLQVQRSPCSLASCHSVIHVFFTTLSSIFSKLRKTRPLHQLVHTTSIRLNRRVLLLFIKYLTLIKTERREYNILLTPCHPWLVLVGL